MQVYISGVISDGGRLAAVDQACNALAFIETEERLKALGHQPINPYGLHPTIGPCTTRAQWCELMRRALAVLLTCDAIVMLPGWEQSEGAVFEHGVARRVEMTFLDPQTLGMPEAGEPAAR